METVQVVPAKYESLEFTIEGKKFIGEAKFDFSLKYEINVRFHAFDERKSKFLKAVRLALKDTQDVMITLEGHNSVWDVKAIKRYTIASWGGLKIEHRPFEDNVYEVKNVTEHDSFTKLLNALSKDIGEQIDKHIKR